VSARASIICGKGTANVAESREGGKKKRGCGRWSMACGARVSGGRADRVLWVEASDHETTRHPTPPGPDRTWTARHACGVGAAVCPHDDML
jgi:hypothetical protein